MPRDPMLSVSASAILPTTCPIGNVPYDVLREIFIHYIQRRPDRLRFTKVTEPPMLLSQVCSSWRTVAFTSPILWSQLSFYLHAAYIRTKAGVQHAVAKKDIEFIQWWKDKQGSIPPIITMNLFVQYPSKMDQKHILGVFDFILTYLASARYLKIHLGYWKEMEKKQIICRNLHTLAMSGNWDDMDNTFRTVQTVIDLTSKASPSPVNEGVRYLCLRNGNLSSVEIIQHPWSSLTHILMWDMNISHNIWHAILRAAPALQWGHFSIDETTLTTLVSNTEKCTLMQLSTLFVRCTNISLLFIDLYFPTLRTLSLSAKSLSWRNGRIITQLHGILERTPAITRLALGEGFLCLENPRYFSSISPAPALAPPIWKYTPHLTDLHLSTPYGYSEDPELAEGQLKSFVKCVSELGNYLALYDPACPLRSITVVDNNLDKIREGKIPTCLDHANIFRNLDLQFTSESIEQEAFEHWEEWSMRM